RRRLRGRDGAGGVGGSVTVTPCRRVYITVYIRVVTLVDLVFLLALTPALLPFRLGFACQLGLNSTRIAFQVLMDRVRVGVEFGARLAVVALLVPEAGVHQGLDHPGGAVHLGDVLGHDAVGDLLRGPGAAADVQADGGCPGCEHLGVAVEPVIDLEPGHRWLPSCGVGRGAGVRARRWGWGARV